MNRKSNTSLPSQSLALVALFSFASVPLAQEDIGRQLPPSSDQKINPELFELSLTPKYLAEAPIDDPWNDYADRLHYRSNLSIWAAGIHGAAGKGDFESSIDVSFSDLFDKLNAGAGLDFEAGKGPFSVLVFAQYMHFEADGQTPRGFDTDLKAQFGLVDIALAYQLLNIPCGSESRLYFDAMGGFRWTYLSQEIGVNEGPFAGRDQNREQNWFDPYLGARVRFDINRHCNVSVLANYGFPGVGADSTWSAYAQFEYRFDSKWSVILGYRALNYNYGNDGFKFDITMQGPVIGLGMRM